MSSNYYNSPDADDIERVPRHVLAQGLKTARSLKPDVAMMEAAARGNAEACLIRDAWGNSNLPTKRLSRSDFAELVSRSAGVVFHG